MWADLTVSGQGVNPRHKEEEGGFAASISPGHLSSSEEGNFHLSFVDAWSGPQDGSSNRHMHFLHDTQMQKKQLKKKKK